MKDRRETPSTVSSQELTFTEVQAAADAAADAVTLQMDEEAFRGFYDRTARMLWAYLHRLTGDRQQADDLLQEAYYRLLSADAVLDTESHRRHYLFRIATNLAHDRFRRGRTRPPHVSYDEAVEAQPAPSGAGLDARLDLDAAMARLASRERAMLWLAYGQGATHAEIASVIGVKTTSVKALLFRARRRLARLLGGRGETS